MTNIFNSPATTTAFDGSDAYANGKQLYLSIFHLPSKLEINLKAFITTYNESFRSDWAQEPVFGRMDNIATFKNTTRTITVNVEIPAFSYKEAKENLGKCNRLAQFLYPGYKEADRANVISKPPLIRLALANLIRAVGGNSPSARDSGLLGFITSFTITPDFDNSNFYDQGAATLYPKTLRVNFDYNPLHEHDLGWSAPGDGIFGFKGGDDELANFPFGKTGLVGWRSGKDHIVNDAGYEMGSTYQGDASGPGFEAWNTDQQEAVIEDEVARLQGESEHMRVSEAVFEVGGPLGTSYAGSELDFLQRGYARSGVAEQINAGDAVSLWRGPIGGGPWGG